MRRFFIDYKKKKKNEQGAYKLFYHVNVFFLLFPDAKYLNTFSKNLIKLLILFTTAASFVFT